MNHPVPTPLFFLSFIPAAVLLVYILRRYAEMCRTRPKIAKADIVYQESFASGASQKNWITKIGGANNCLRLVVTKDLLWITAWFPFGIFAATYDLHHVIPLDKISSVQPDRWFGKDTLLLSYNAPSGASHTVRLIPKNREQFLEALRISPKK